MKKKRIWITLLVLLSGIGSVSCQKKQNNALISLQEFPDTYKKITDNVIIDLDIIIDEDVQERLYESKANRIKVDGNKLMKSLFGNNKDSNHIFKTDEWTYEDQKQQMLYVNGNNVVFTSNSNASQTTLQRLENHLQNDPTRMSTGFSDTNMLIEDVQNQLEYWDLEEFELYTNYSIESTNEKGNTCMYWLGYEECQGLSVFSDKYYSGLSDLWAPLQIFGTPDKIEKIRILYGYKFLVGETPIQLKKFDEIANSIEKEYSMLLTDNEHAAVKAELAFWVDDIYDKDELEMEPVWVITMQEYVAGDRNNFTEYQEVYSAITTQNVERKR